MFFKSLQAGSRFIQIADGLTELLKLAAHESFIDLPIYDNGVRWRLVSVSTRLFLATPAEIRKQKKDGLKSDIILLQKRKE